MSEENSFVKICKVSDLKDRSGKRFIVNEVDIAVFKVDGEIYALSNICPHQHTALIYDGFIEENCVVCPAHGWEFQLKTGNMKTGRKGLDSYPVEVRDDEVYIKVFQKRYNW